MKINITLSLRVNINRTLSLKIKINTTFSLKLKMNTTLNLNIKYTPKFSKFNLNLGDWLKLTKFRILEPEVTKFS